VPVACPKEGQDPVHDGQQRYLGRALLSTAKRGEARCKLVRKLLVFANLNRPGVQHAAEGLRPRLAPGLAE
jgi:hypothetical protein